MAATTATTATNPSFQLRSLYRSVLRELPIRPLSASKSPLRERIHSIFSSPPTSTASPTASSSTLSKDSQGELRRQIQEGEQFVQFAKAQRVYAMLLERYNPGMEMGDEERVRLTARRVGMDLPAEVDLEGWEGKGKGE